jgi:hypothetical protein
MTPLTLTPEQPKTQRQSQELQKFTGRRTEHVTLSNPFSTRWVRPGMIPFQFAPGCGAAKLTERLALLNWRAAIRGPHGSGKSTLLAALLPEIERRGHRPVQFALHDGQRRLPATLIAAFPCESATIVVLDGYEQLSRWSRWRLDRLCRRSDCGLLVTTHGATRLAELFHTVTDIMLAQQVVKGLLPDDYDVITRQDVADAFTANVGDLRETLFSLYDLVEQRRPRSVATRSELPRG